MGQLYTYLGQTSKVTVTAVAKDLETHFVKLTLGRSERRRLHPVDAATSLARRTGRGVTPEAAHTLHECARA